MMGEIAEAILNGDLCEVCGEWLGIGDGYARRCSDCQPPPTGTKTKNGHQIYRPSKVNCHICNKLVKKGQGLKDHLRVVHNKQ